MQNFKKMYLCLFNAITGALRAIEKQDFARAQAILMQAQQRTEELYLDESITP
ncbi:MAG: hypothetical protein HPZ79_03620 [Oscillospiraceae bacterium]|nr:hypothetical protein [Oscillospiraceae bacterium]